MTPDHKNLIRAAMVHGAPWSLALEAAASFALDRTGDGQTIDLGLQPERRNVTAPDSGRSCPAVGEP